MSPRRPAGPAGLADLVASGVLVASAGGLLRQALAPDRMPGVALGEGWGHLYMAAQVERWVTGQAPWGRADLLAWPRSLDLWPTDPLVLALQVPLSWLMGPLGALVAVTALLLALAGIGPQVLARTAGASPLGGLVAGLVVQLSPFLLRNGADLVVEVLAVGPLALAAAAILAHVEGPRPRPWPVGLGVLAVAGTSPYYAVYLALLCGLCALLQPRRWRRWVGVAAAGGLACGLAFLPLWATESGPEGRLGPGFAGRGFEVAPTALVRPDGSPVRRDRNPNRDQVVQAGQAPGRGATPPAAPPSPWLRVVHRLPGGGTVLLACLLGLGHRASRRYAGLGLALVLAGPDPWTTAPALGIPLPRWEGPLAWLLQQVPLLDRLGNASRLGGLSAICGGAAAGLLVTRLPALAVAWPVLALVEVALRFPGLALPATQVQVPAGVLDRLEGPVVIFPSGDPPYWHPEVAPKEALFLAGLAGTPVAYDYGRLTRPGDLAAQVRLATVAGAPIGVTAVQTAPPLPDSAEAWAALPFQAILVLEDRLTPVERLALRRWLEAHATLQARNGDWSAWSWPDRFTAPAGAAPAPTGSAGSPPPAPGGG